MSFAELKRRLKVGAKIELVRHDFYPNIKYPHDIVPPKLQGVREVITARATYIEFSGGSRLEWPKTAEIRACEVGFDVCLSEDGSFAKLMRYEFR